MNTFLRLAEALQRASGLIPETLAALFVVFVLGLIGLDMAAAMGGSLLDSGKPPRIDVPRVNKGKHSLPKDGCFVMPDGSPICVHQQPESL